MKGKVSTNCADVFEDDREIASSYEETEISDGIVKSFKDFILFMS